MGDAALGPMLMVPAVQSTGGPVEKLDMGSCLMKVIMWTALEIKTHSLFQVVQVATFCARAPQCHSCSLLLNVRDILGPVVFPLYSKCLLENLSSFQAQDLVLIRID